MYLPNVELKFVCILFMSSIEISNKKEDKIT
ncbi:hypothetical protein PSM36_2804 [Proteiniphilum saccharofermentans]|uniref:Uncharacterized protein n=1 Tax=Proteiniphilum saccharofermentans TaxID=1642647 RepID=A0A1R3T365_9BACT|nr:hypothetical protein PSM36_2804 [Proteiniphilum saccharofermentans]SEA47810.1 hypothetical protein SAMN05216331_15910 [Porphyromonadaceae bacterium KH3R12]SFK26407.1 hypothetical protein SAMN05216357_10167 [Porphyromonadaceae bacterium KH3CP3RA]SFS52790.1 hypothetical protein SAMN05216365_11052 [Porphyromonadaceae bacterium NLAE-zl-C104]